jgi:hypothetical protein
MLGGLRFGYDTGVISDAIEPLTVKCGLSDAMKGWASGNGSGNQRQIARGDGAELAAWRKVRVNKNIRRPDRRQTAYRSK